MRKHVKAKHIDILCSITAIMCGVLGVIVLKDATALLAALLIAPVLFFRKHTYW